MPCLTTIPLDVKKVSCHSCKNWRENNKGFSVGNKCPPRMTCESSEAEKGVQNAWTIGAQEKARKYTLPVASDCDDTSILSEKILPRWIFTEMSVQFFNSVPWAFFWAINNIWTFGFASRFAFKKKAKKRTAPLKMTSKSELDFNKLPFEPYIVHFGAAIWEIWANLLMTYKWVS